MRAEHASFHQALHHGRWQRLLVLDPILVRDDQIRQRPCRVGPFLSAQARTALGLVQTRKTPRHAKEKREGDRERAGPGSDQRCQRCPVGGPLPVLGLADDRVRGRPHLGCGAPETIEA